MLSFGSQDYAIFGHASWSTGNCPTYSYLYYAYDILINRRSLKRLDEQKTFWWRHFQVTYKYHVIAQPRSLLSCGYIAVSMKKYTIFQSNTIPLFFVIIWEYGLWNITINYLLLLTDHFFHVLNYCCPFYIEPALLITTSTKCRHFHDFGNAGCWKKVSFKHLHR